MVGMCGNLRAVKIAIFGIVEVANQIIFVF
jgi:hypothetical protein